MECPICGSSAELKYEIPFYYGKYMGRLFECENCRFLFVSNPSWLAESYRHHDPATTDVGSCKRSLNAARTVILMKRAGLLKKTSKILDYGSGYGLTVNLLSDKGYRIVGYDKYRKPVFGYYNISFGEDADIPEDPVDLILAIEVFEHLTDPIHEMSGLFSILRSSSILYATTNTYDPQKHNENWDYIRDVPGQHVSFYSKESLNYIAELYGCRVFIDFPRRGHHIFFKDYSSRLRLNLFIFQFFRIIDRMLVKLFGIVSF